MANTRADEKKLEVLDLLQHFEDMLTSSQGDQDCIAFINEPHRTNVLKYVQALRERFEIANKKKVDAEQGNGWDGANGNGKGAIPEGEPGGRVELSGFLDWHKAHEEGRELWTHLMRAAIADIDPNAKGHSELLKYLKAATEFEDLLYGLEPFYRDHTLHSLWVYLIGVKLMGTGGELNLIAENLNWYVYNDVREVENSRPIVSWASLEEKCLNEAIQEKRDAIWCIIALCHDLGYSLAKLAELNKKVQAVLKYYDVSDFRHVGYTLDLEHQYLVTQCLELMAMDVRITPANDCAENVEGDAEHKLVDYIKAAGEVRHKKLENGIERDSLHSLLMEAVPEESRGAASDVYDSVLTKCYRDDASYWRLCRALERKEHGILSAYLLYKTMGLFADTSVRAPAEEWGLDDDEAVDNIIRGDILFAIAQHEFAFAHIDQMSSLAEILILCDELEEFTRLGRQLQSRKYHDTTAEAGVEIKTVPEGETDPCKTRVEIVMKYDSRHENKDEFVNFCCRKAARMCKLFSLAPDKRGRSVNTENMYRIKEIRTEFNYCNTAEGGVDSPHHIVVFVMKDSGTFDVELTLPDLTDRADLECRDDAIYVTEQTGDTELEKWLKGKSRAHAT